MIGQPELTLQHAGLAIAAETQALWLGALDFAHAPGQLPPESARFMSDDSVNYINDLLERQRISEHYAVLANPQSLAWGVQQQTEAERRCIGLLGFTGIPSIPPFSGVKEAESHITLWSERLGQGIGRVAYERMCAFGLAAGLDVIFASVSDKNERSLALHKSCGFVACGTYLYSGQTRFDMRLYNPGLSDATVRVLRTSRINRNSYRAPAATEVDQAKERAAAMRSRHPDLDALVQASSMIIDRFNKALRVQPNQ